MIETVEMTVRERIEFEEFKAEKAKKEQSERQKQNREAYKQLIDETIDGVFPGLESVSNAMAATKASVYESFQKALLMKQSNPTGKATRSGMPPERNALPSDNT